MVEVKGRPAETVGAVGGFAGVVYGVAAHDWATAVVALSGWLPAVVTFVVTHGGIRGVFGQFWRGKAK